VVNHPLLAHVHQRLGLLEQRDVAAMIASETAHNASDISMLPGEWRFDYTTFSRDGWQSAGHAMLQHLMLLWRIRSGTAQQYTSFSVWDFDALGYGSNGRWSVNAFAYWARDMAKMDVSACRASPDDEHFLSVDWPAIMQRRVFTAALPRDSDTRL